MNESAIVTLETTSFKFRIGYIPSVDNIKHFKLQKTMNPSFYNYKMYVVLNMFLGLFPFTHQLVHMTQNSHSVLTPN
jgi:hypothetical protein